LAMTKPARFLDQPGDALPNERGIIGDDDAE
jgi:hypothetical protein